MFVVLNSNKQPTNPQQILQYLPFLSYVWDFWEYVCSNKPQVFNNLNPNLRTGLWFCTSTSTRDSLARECEEAQDRQLLLKVSPRKGKILQDINIKAQMKPSEQPEIKEQNNPSPVQKSWIDFICDDSLRLAIPVGPRFQADLPALTISPGKYGEQNIDSKSESKKFLGIRVWPTGGRDKEINDGVIGKGRPKSCLCISPGSVECVKKHTTAKRIQLQSDLGPAFWKWKFDNMGEDVSKLWNVEEQRKFQCGVKMHAKSLGQSFINSALEHLPCHSRESIVSYYLNVHIPRRMSKQSRLNCTRIDTDDESEDSPPPKGSRKRLQANIGTSNICKYVKTKYLMGRR